jgi:hypothetical protein
MTASLHSITGLACFPCSQLSTPLGALPTCPTAEGSAAELTAASPAADGSLLVTVAATLPRGSSTAAEEAQYMAAVLQNDAKQARHCLCHLLACLAQFMLGFHSSIHNWMQHVVTHGLPNFLPAGVHPLCLWRRQLGVCVGAGRRLCWRLPRQRGPAAALSCQRRSWRCRDG